MIEFLVCLGIILGAWMWSIRASEKDEEKKVKKYEEEGLVYRKEYSYVKYLGGFGDIAPDRHSDIILFKDRIRIFDRDILFENIKDCSIQTHTQLVERASLGKLLCFGVFALGMKGKTKELNKAYVVIRCVYRKKEIDLILDLGGRKEKYMNEKFVSTIRAVAC